MGMSTQSVHPGIGNDSGARLPPPNRFRTLSAGTWCAAVIRSSTSRITSLRAGDTTNWYCRNPRGP